MISKHTNTKKPLYYYITLLLLPLAGFYALEYYTHDPWDMAFLSQLINYLILFFLGTGIAFLCNSLFAPLFLITGYCLLAGILNYFVLDFRGNPILPWDIYSISTALSVSDNYTYQLKDRFYPATGVLVLALLLGLVAACRYRRFKRCNSQTATSKPVPRLLTGLVSLTLALTLSLAMMDARITKEVLTPTNLFTQWASYRDNGFTVTFIENLQYLKISKPKNYNKENLAQELETFLGLHDLVQSSAKEAPQVFVIMDEAFSDLAVLHDFQTNQDYMPFLHSLQNSQKDNVTTGNLFVSVCGGNTANTEFEFLTGNSLAYLPIGSVAYQQYIHGDLPSLASAYSKKGYFTAGIHPYGAAGWNRDKVYPWLGFQLAQFKDTFRGAQILRKYISDQSAMARLQDLYNSLQDKPEKNLFAWEVTMQNHGGYTEEFPDCPNEIAIQNTSHPYARYTNQYLTLIQKTDQALEAFLGWVDQQKDPIMVVFFGDHQPNDYVAEAVTAMTGKSKEDMNLEESQNRYVVPYLIYTNYEQGKETSTLFQDCDKPLLDQNTMSANYLGTEIARISGLPLSPYQEFLQVMRQILPVITANVVIDSQGRYMTLEEAKKDYGDYLNLYEKLQYYYLFDQGAESGLF